MSKSTLVRRSHATSHVLSIVALASLSMPCFAEQVEITSVHVNGPLQVGTEDDLRTLETQFKGGDLVAARRTAGRMLSKAHELSSQVNPNPYDLSRNVVVVVWADADVAGSSVLRRLTLPEPSSYAHSLDLPGLQDDEGPPYLHEVLIARDRRARLVSQYTFTREESPVVAQIPTVAERLAGPLFSLLGSVGGTLSKAVPDPAESKAAPPPIFASASRVGVPFPRASIKVKSIARVPATIDEWAKEVQTLATVLRFETVARSEWGKEYSDRLVCEAVRVAGQPVCTGEAAKVPPESLDKLVPACNFLRQVDAGPKAEPAAKPGIAPSNACLRAFGAAFDMTYKECIESCASGVPTKADIEAIEAVDQKFRSFVASGGPALVQRDLEIKNRPLTHVSFGLGTAYIVKGSLSRDRAKVDDAGNLVPDPLGRVMTMILINWSPPGYDEDAPSPQTWERFRLFAGGTVTPDPGIAVGGSILVVRGLAINLGYAMLFTGGLGDGDEFGKPPTEKRDPLALATADALFVGFTLNFK